MRYLTISEFGSFLGFSGANLIVHDKNGNQWQTPLSRLRSIRIEKKGVSLSSDLLLSCASRGIRLYFCDWKGCSVATVQGDNQKGIVSIRQHQFEFCDSIKCVSLAVEIIKTKIKNQRAVLLYFGKYLKKSDLSLWELCSSSVSKLEQILSNVCEATIIERVELYRAEWQSVLLGIEGTCANIYWNTLINCHLLPKSFKLREGRGSTELTNAALNYGYSILESYVWSALDNTGLDIFKGIFHKNHPGRASLVMDFMEEYRAWVVDRNIIKLRFQLADAVQLDSNLKRAISESINDTMASKINWHGKNLKLENIMQRQAYKFAGCIIGETKYKGYKFKW